MTNETFEQENTRGIDQCNCADCGRTMMIWEDDPRTMSEIQCGRCERGLSPLWEY